MCAQYAYCLQVQSETDVQNYQELSYTFVPVLWTLSESTSTSITCIDFIFASLISFAFSQKMS